MSASAALLLMASTIDDVVVEDDEGWSKCRGARRLQAEGEEEDRGGSVQPAERAGAWVYRRQKQACEVVDVESDSCLACFSCATCQVGTFKPEVFWL